MAEIDDIFKALHDQMQQIDDPEGEVVKAVLNHALDSKKTMNITSQWQPIDTIPMDGTPVLVWLPEPFFRRSHVQVANYKPNCRIVGNVFAFDLVKQPTHWMPLPDGPKASE